ncbi:MAG: iron chelate uptake ABC transporter family permease subunit [Elusimicrobia bacterium]|nr:iron chelate uptake ABC transporter family permease subunit [Elusimicrobiota bacterium]MBD3412557.1 iron chelate uptake ABC transporter family permease subunit [Elusimicrobiota bacterium]
MELLSYAFIRNALIAGMLASIACGIIGTLVVNKRIVAICGGIAHASFGGIGLGYLMHVNPSISGLMFGIMSGLGIGWLSKKTKKSEDTSIAILWSVGMSLGIIFVSLSSGYVPDLFTYLFGNILSVTTVDIIAILILDCIIILWIWLVYKETMAICFDEQFSQIRGVPVNLLYLTMLVMVALTVGILMKVVGIILVIALLSLPAATAAKYTRTLKGMMILSIFLSMFFIISGLMISYFGDLPSGATIILFASAIFLLDHLRSILFRNKTVQK